MEAFRIRGGNTISGEVQADGAKNAALPLLAATLLTGQPCTIGRVPDLADVRTMRSLLTALGTTVEANGATVALQTPNITSTEAPYDLVKTMRASILVLGPLLARTGEARVSLPGGCAIGARPISLHLEGLARMGAEIKIEHGYVVAKAKKLTGCRLYLDFPTVTGTMNLMMAATLADGVMIIENAACEPEVKDLADFLIRMGARIDGAGTDRLVIEGVPALSGAHHAMIPDRIEVGTLMLAAAITRGDVTVTGLHPAHLEALIQKLREAGATVDVTGDSIRTRASGKLHAVSIRTLPHPGFPTDLQAQFMALMTVTEGMGIVTETIFESRFTHVAEYARMGANIRLEGQNAIVTGMDGLSGAEVMATDLRASAGLVLAGLVADGETLVRRIYHLDRGYEKLEQKLGSLGADVARVTMAG
ncbi:MAG: UDP-N-acetylglucosamine 1-carboxyvinyltransferase [Nitrospirota bacterium]|nr:UDP-N-acetylglucosamine 1-carboxyvinyltransferase [Nitrospirota bacterium]